jgi:hypothetical protein
LPTTVGRLWVSVLTNLALLGENRRFARFIDKPDGIVSVAERWVSLDVCRDPNIQPGPKFIQSANDFSIDALVPEARPELAVTRLRAS